VRACLCAALNPPCPTCTDTGVLLACITVDNCEVTNICEQGRKYIVSGPALRYWIPFDRMNHWIEYFCCEPIEKLVCPEAASSGIVNPGNGYRPMMEQVTVNDPVSNPFTRLFARELKSGWADVARYTIQLFRCSSLGRIVGLPPIGPKPASRAARQKTA
jgi:hypothetical protein